MRSAHSHHGTPAASAFAKIVSPMSVTLRIIVTRSAAALEPAPQHVERDGRAHVPDVRGGLNGRATEVDPDLARLERHEVADAAGRGIEEAERHGVQATGVMSAVATAATPSPLPVRPRPSDVVADRDTGAPIASESNASASARRAPRRGRFAMI